MIEILSWLNATAILLLYQFNYVVYDTQTTKMSLYNDTPTDTWFPKAGNSFSDNVIIGNITGGQTVYAIRGNAQSDSYPSRISGYIDLDRNEFFMRINSGDSLTETINVIDLDIYGFFRGKFEDPNIELHLSDTIFFFDDNKCYNNTQGLTIGIISYDKICTRCTLDYFDEENCGEYIELDCANIVALPNSNNTLMLQEGALVIYDEYNITLASISSTTLFCMDRFSYTNLSISNYTYQPYFRAFTWTEDGKIGIMYYESCLVTWLSTNVLQYFGLRPTGWYNNTEPNIGTYNGTHFQLFNRTDDDSFNITRQCTDLVYTSRPRQICIVDSDINVTCTPYQYVDISNNCRPFQKCSSSYHMHPTTTSDVECVEGIVTGHSTPFYDFEVEAVYNNRDRQGLLFDDPACDGLIGEYIDGELQGCIEQSSSCLFGIGALNECLPAERPPQSVCIANIVSTSPIEVGQWRNCKKVETYVAKFGTSAIGSFAFYNSSVKTVLIEQSATYIGVACFAHSNLYQLEIQVDDIYLIADELEFGLPIHEGLFSYSLSLHKIIGLDKLNGLSCYDFIETNLTTFDYISNGMETTEVTRCKITKAEHLKITDTKSYEWIYPTAASSDYSNNSFLEVDNSLLFAAFIADENTSLDYMEFQGIVLNTSRLYFAQYILGNFDSSFTVIISEITTDLYSLSWLVSSLPQLNTNVNFGTILLTDVILNNDLLTNDNDLSTNVSLKNLTANKLILQTNVIIGDNVFENLNVQHLDLSLCATVSPNAFIGANCDYKAGYKYDNCVKSPSDDTNCVPCLSNYYRNGTKCIECSSGCGPGYYYKTPCTTHSDLVCVPCEQGTYQDRTNHKIKACLKQSDDVFSTMFTILKKDKRLYKIIATCLLSVPLLYNIVSSGVRKFWVRKTKV